MTAKLRLGVNIDHVATIRNARGGPHPDPVRAAHIAAKAGADGITAHLREDRRHITDEDIDRLMAEIDLPLNLEMAATEEMLSIALRHRPHAACIVPERREERTTEGGLDAAGQRDHLAYFVDKLGAANIRVSLFIEPSEEQVAAAVRLGAPVVEFHTGRYAHVEGEERAIELKRIADAAALATKNGIEPHAGHGLTFDNVIAVAAIPQLAELNIGHFLVGEAIFTGLEDSVRQMRALMDTGPMILGIGSDLCNIERIQASVDRFGDRFLSRVFTEVERAKAARRPHTMAGTLAKRFAAKEAFSKAVGTGFKRGVYMKDIGVVNAPSGAPTLRLTGGAKARLDALAPAGHAVEVHLTMTDDHPWAQAFVILYARKMEP